MASIKRRYSKEEFAQRGDTANGVVCFPISSHY